jgi:hypothetical protein
MSEHRNPGLTDNCHGCRYWSEMIARSVRLEVHALCLVPRGTPGALYPGRYTAGWQTCPAWASGHLGPVDEPGDDGPDKYNAESE